MVVVTFSLMVRLCCEAMGLVVSSLDEANCTVSSGGRLSVEPTQVAATVRSFCARVSAFCCCVCFGCLGDSLRRTCEFVDVIVVRWCARSTSLLRKCVLVSLVPSARITVDGSMPRKSSRATTTLDPTQDLSTRGRRDCLSSIMI